MAGNLMFPDDFRPDFEGIGPKGFRFLRGIAKNNDRAWFAAHRDEYETEVRFPLECLAAEFGGDRGGDLAVRGDPRKSLFRIYRDVRFSRNKSPYKTHSGAILSRGGARGEPGVVYIHIEPGNCFVSAGFWRADTALLTAWRMRMTADPDEWLAIVTPYAGPDSVPYMRSISQLKTMPRGFKDCADSPVADYLKWKSFLLTRPVADAEAGGRGLVDIVRAHAVAATPLLEFGWRLVDRPAAADPRRHLRATA